MRTWGRCRVVDWPAHVTRLVESAALLTAADPTGAAATQPVSPLQVTHLPLASQW